MSNSLKGLIDKILYALAVALAIVFVMGIIFEVGSMARISLWALMFAGAGISAMQVYEYLWRNTDKSKDTMLLVQMVAAVVTTLLIIAFTIFVLNGKLVTLPV